MRCMQCGCVQHTNQYCMNVECGQTSKNDSTSMNSKSSLNNNSNNIQSSKYSMGRYYCNICKFWDNTPSKAIFHCNDCHLCRLGNREDFKHCSKCDCCWSYKYYPGHKCIENSLQSCCPICLEYMHNSRESVMLWLPCAHPLHHSCAKKYGLSSGCPVCREPYFNEQYEKRQRQLLALKKYHEQLANSESGNSKK